MKAFLHRIYANDRSLQAALLICMLAWCGALLAISWRLSINDPVRLTFNNMLDHLLHGRFDVDPQIILDEGYVRDGKVYSYFGIWCALLRIPLLIAGRMDVDMTLVSCLTAVCVAGMAKVRAVLLIRRHAVAGPAAQSAIGLMLAYIVLAGSGVAYLQKNIYMEVVFWAYAFAAIFVYLALRGIVGGGFSLRILNGMAACAGLALLTRVSTGVGLIVTLVLLLLALQWQSGAVNRGQGGRSFSAFGRALLQTRMLIPLGILGSLMTATGLVNYFRWGNPATFVNYDLYLGAPANFLASLHTYGAFNLRRIPFGMIYYFVPVWVLRDSQGQFLFPSMQSTLFGLINVPPASFFLTDMLPFGFIGLLVVALRKRRTGFSLLPTAAVAAGLLVPCLLMLSLSWMMYRYRMEFYPEIEFLALLGLYATVTSDAMLARLRGYKLAFRASLAVSIAASLLALALCDLSRDGEPADFQRSGIVGYYVDLGTYHLHRSHRWVQLHP